MNHSRHSLVLLILLSAFALQGQNLLQEMGTTQVKEQARDSVVLRPFTTTTITGALNESNRLISESANMKLSGKAIASYRQEVDSLFSSLDRFMGDSSLRSIESSGLRELNLLSERVDYFSKEMNDYQDRLSRTSLRFRETLSSLSDNKARWKLTLEDNWGEVIVEERRVRISPIMTRIDSVSAILEADLGQLVLQQDRLSDKINDLELLSEQIGERKAMLGEHLFTIDSPGLFGEISDLKNPDLVTNHIDQMRRMAGADWAVFKSDFLSSMIFFFFLFLFFLGFAIWFKNNLKRMLVPEKQQLSDIQKTLVHSPVVFVVFIITVLIRFIFPELPRTFAYINLLIMLPPLAILVIRLFGKKIRSWILILVLVMSLSIIYELFYYADFLQRIVLFGFSITALWLLIWVLLNKPLRGKIGNQTLYRAFRLLTSSFSILLFIAIIANLVGAFSLAEFFTLITIHISILAISITVLIKVTDTLIFLILSGQYLQRFNVIRDEFGAIYQKSVRLVTILLWIFFISNALRIIRAQDAVFEWGRRVFTNGIKFGAVDITLGNILIFVFVIWLSVAVTRMLRYILEKDVFTRVKTAKGVPSTIILLTRIALITGGFFLAAKAAGMALTNLSIVLGAFSVGIGFGLQNIFNNMVSGLILAFERPIKVGDVVQVGELTGVVLSIGLRSSTVRSFDGAEVIVPNGNLISNEMINWTKSDANRRMDIRVGVAYGTNPKIVLELLRDIAENHENVQKEPPPRPYFLGFGDSSLDFRLLAWTDMEHRLETESEISVLINEKLAEAGIEIPFPQRDLHIRSDATKSENKQSTESTKET